MVKSYQKNKKGIAHIAIFILIILIVLIGYFVYTMMMSGTKLNEDNNTSQIDREMNIEENYGISEDEVPPPSENGPVSESTDLEVIESELEDTNVASPMDELQELESEASGL